MLEWMALASGMMIQAENPCRMIADFGDSREIGRWQVINDGVMGGLSRGRIEPDDGAMLFAGEINTDGGGFSSLRREVERGSLANARQLRIVMRSDARTYQMTFRSDVSWRGRSVAYRATLEPKADEDGWQVATVSMDALEPSIFGQRVRAPDYVPAETRSIGFIIADGRDGPFALRVRSIEMC